MAQADEQRDYRLAKSVAEYPGYQHTVAGDLAKRVLAQDALMEQMAEALRDMGCLRLDESPASDGIWNKRESALAAYRTYQQGEGR